MAFPFDFMATILEALGIAGGVELDGRSYLPLLFGEKQENRDTVFTQFHTTAAKGVYPMRCMQNGQFGYIFNAWSDGVSTFRNESMTGLTFQAMETAGEKDEETARRVQFFTKRCLEEFYDFSVASDAMCNLIEELEYQEKIRGFREGMKRYMEDTEDPLMASYEKMVLRKV